MLYERDGGSECCALFGPAAVGLAQASRSGGNALLPRCVALLLRIIRDSHAQSPSHFKAACQALAAVAPAAPELDDSTSQLLQRVMSHPGDGGMTGAAALALGAILARADADIAQVKPWGCAVVKCHVCVSDWFPDGDEVIQSA